MIAVLIDGQYLYRVQQELGYERIDLRAFVNELVKKHPHKAWYFTNDIPSETAAEKHDRFLDAIRERGLKVVKGSVIKTEKQCPHCGQVLIDYEQKEVDVAIAVTAMEVSRFASKVILVSGDGDFVPLLRALERRAVTVLVAHQPSEYLKKHADSFIELEKVLAKVAERARPTDFVCPQCGHDKFRKMEQEGLVHCARCGAVLKI